MTLRFSTGHKKRILGKAGTDTGANGFRGIYENCVIDLYTGTQPATADAAATGTLLGRLTLNGGAFTEGASTNGLNWAAPADDGTTDIPAGAVWSCSALADGVIGWFRIRGNAVDAGGVSTTLPRIDGSAGITSGDLRLSVVSVTAGTPVVVQKAPVSI